MLSLAVTGDPYQALRPAVEEMTRLGRTRWEIADTPNTQGVSTKSGRPWTETTVAHLCNELGIRPRTQADGAG